MMATTRWPTHRAADFRKLTVGGAHSCGIKPNDRVVCWGSDDVGQVSDTPGARFRQVDAAGYD